LILIDQQGPQKRVGPCWCGEINGWNGGGKATNKKMIDCSSFIIRHDDDAWLNIFQEFGNWMAF
jgi:hypothetical protein